MENKKFFIIDGNSLIYRTFYALPPLTNSRGLQTNALYGFASIINKIIEEEKPDYFGVAFDEKKPTFRHKEFGDYKAGRLKMPEELAMQIPLLHKMLDAFGIKKISLAGFEADDLIGTLSKMGEMEDLKINIITGDRDAFQLASDKTSIWYTKRGISEMDIVDKKEILNRYGLKPEQLIDVKALMGDKSDNIPGVPKVGEKTALKLINQYQSLEEVYKHIDEVGGKVVRENLIEYKQQAVLSEKLAKIVRDIPLEAEISDFILENPYKEELLELFKEWEFNSFLEKFHSDGIKEDDVNKKIAYEVITSPSELEEIINGTKKKRMYLQWHLAGEDHHRQNLEGFGFAFNKEELYFVSLQDIEVQKVLQNMRKIFQSKEIKKIAHNIKEFLVFLYEYNIELAGIDFDTYIASYILEPSESKYDLGLLTSKYLNKQITSQEQLLGKGKKALSFDSIEKEEKCTYLMNKLDSVIDLQEQLREKIKEQHMEDLYYEIERPLIKVLASMENLGFKVDQEELENLSKEFGEKIEQLTGEIYQLSEETFNINSPKQLGKILFEKLELPIIKKTKTGYSTNIEVLEKLKDKHPIIEKIIEIRQLSKLKSTYVDGLMTIIDSKTKRVHSSFNQTIASTGRISSSEPNLQNIPIKLEMGRRIRKVFVPEDTEYILVDGDYSQIELRILAHISKDENLIEAFNKDQDIHTRTAAEVFGVEMKDVTSLMRSRAKAVNFGIVYGISDYGLSRDLDIPRKEAKEYIDRYKEKYSGVNTYMNEIVKEAKKDGFVKTLFGRRRYIPELHSRNFNIRSFGERLALNTPIQGAAADIIKIAMIRVYNRLKEENKKSRLLLQVHDELIIEAHKDELEEVKVIMKEEMEKAATLEVPLKVDIQVGKNWYEAK